MKANNAPSKLSILTNGIIKENPVLVLVLGTCPTLAVTTAATNAIGMVGSLHIMVQKIFLLRL